MLDLALLRGYKCWIWHWNPLPKSADKKALLLWLVAVGPGVGLGWGLLRHLFLHSSLDVHTELGPSDRKALLNLWPGTRRLGPGTSLARS